MEIEFRKISKNGKSGYSIALSASKLKKIGLVYGDNVKLEYEEGKIVIRKYTEIELKKDLLEGMK